MWPNCRPGRPPIRLPSLLSVVLLVPRLLFLYEFFWKLGMRRWLAAAAVEFSCFRPPPSSAHGPTSVVVSYFSLLPSGFDDRVKTGDRPTPGYQYQPG